MKKFLTRYEYVIIAVFLVIIAICYSLISISSHNHFLTFGWDLGFFDQIIWKASQGDFVAFSTIAYENLLADHFQPVLYLLAPLYFIKSDVRMLLIAQSFLVVSAGFPLYVLAKKVSKNIVFSFALLFSYLFFLGAQWTILNEFHQAAFIPIFLSLVFLSLYLKNSPVYFFAILGLLATKEEMGLLVFAIGLLVVFQYQEVKKGALTIILGIFSFFFLIYGLMPVFSVSKTYKHFGFGEAGYTPLDVIKKVIFEPLFFLKSMINPFVKVKTLFQTFFAFAFLLPFAPYFLIPVFQQFATRFIYAGPQFTKWVNVNHHAAPLGILMAVGSLYALGNIACFLKKRYKLEKSRVFILGGILLITASFGQDILLHGPINSIFKPQLYLTQKWMKDNYQIIEFGQKLPPDISVAAQNSLVPHLSQREKIYLLPEINEAQYIFVDFYKGSNKYSPITYNEMKDLIDTLLETGEYSLVKRVGDALVLKKVGL